MEPVSAAGTQPLQAPRSCALLTSPLGQALCPDLYEERSEWEGVFGRWKMREQIKLLPRLLYVDIEQLSRYPWPWVIEAMLKKLWSDMKQN